MGSIQSLLARLVMASAVLWVAGFSVALAHPYEDFDIKPKPSYYGHNASIVRGLDNGSMIFYDETPAEELSPAERYMLWGCQPARRGSETATLAFSPWFLHIYKIVKNYYEKTGLMPESISPQVIADSMGIPVESLSQAQLDVARSPITGDYPTINSEDFSAGNLYIRLLTQEEKVFLASNLEYYRLTWFNLLQYEPSIDDYVPIRHLSPIFYLRIYGEDHPLDSRIQYTVTTD